MTVVGAVSSLMRYPVKSMLGEELAEVEVTAGGVSGDRAYALVDDETGKVVSVKRPRRRGRIFELAASTSGGDGAGGGAGGGVTVALPGDRCPLPVPRRLRAVTVGGRMAVGDALALGQPDGMS